MWVSESVDGRVWIDEESEDVRLYPTLSDNPCNLHLSSYPTEGSLLLTWLNAI